MSDRVRVLRLVQYEGPRDAIEKQIANSLHGSGKFGPNQSITITTFDLDMFPKVIDVVPEAAPEVKGE